MGLLSKIFGGNDSNNEQNNDENGKSKYKIFSNDGVLGEGEVKVHKDFIDFWQNNDENLIKHLNSIVNGIHENGDDFWHTSPDIFKGNELEDIQEYIDGKRTYTGSDISHILK